MMNLTIVLSGCRNHGWSRCGNPPRSLANRAVPPVAAAGGLRGQHVELDENNQPVVVDPTPDEIRALTRIRVNRASEHGLPYLAPERRPDWIAEGLEHLYRLDNDLPPQPPDWWDEPAIVVVSASLPNHVERHPDARPYSSLAVSQTPLLGPVVAPWYGGFDPASATWFDLTGREVRVIYPGTGFIGEALGQAMRRVWYSVDQSALDPDGIPANLATEGLLTPSPVVATVVHKVGKESRHLGVGREVLSGPEQLNYGSDDYWPDLSKALSLLASEPASKASVAAEAEISTRWLEEIVSRRIRPSAKTESRIVRVAARRAGDWIGEMRPSAELAQTEVGILCQYLDLSPAPARLCQQCGRLLKGRQQAWCSDACRKTFHRRRTAQMTLFPITGSSDVSPGPEAT
jgi:hypothetical protein